MKTSTRIGRAWKYFRKLGKLRSSTAMRSKKASVDIGRTKVTEITFDIQPLSIDVGHEWVQDEVVLFTRP